MHPRSQDKPTQKDLVFPLLETLHQAAGSARAADVADALAEQFQLAKNVRTQTVQTNDGQVVNVWRRHVRFARQRAIAMGYVTSERSHGDWKLTDAGFEGLSHARPAIVVEVLRDADGNPRAARINLAIGVPTTHLLVHGDARDLDWIPDGEIPLIFTSPPYHDIVSTYGSSEGQLGNLISYDEFLDQLDQVWRECYRVLMPGSRLVCSIGDVLRSRGKHGEHHVLPLHADVLARSTRIGFRALNGIIWSKIANCAREDGSKGGYLGKPGQPNGIVPLSHEYLLVLKKPGPYRSPSERQARDSMIGNDDYAKWFRGIWSDIPGASTKNGHPAPFPVELAERIVKMYSFAGDCVLDPFGGSGTTSVAAAMSGRDSVYVERERPFVRMAANRLMRLQQQAKPEQETAQQTLLIA